MKPWNKSQIVLAGLVTAVLLSQAALSYQEDGKGGVAVVAPQGTAFTYQGQLNQGGVPVNATADLDFRLWDAVTGGTFHGGVQHATDVAIANGLFTVDLDFGGGAAGPNARWLEIAVRSPAGGGAFTTLTPRQRLQPTPVALYAINAQSFSLPYLGASALDAYPFQITANADDASAIYGAAPNGQGVEGYGNTGVRGNGSTGVEGTGDSIGVYGSGPTAIYGESEQLGVHGILLQSSGGSGVKGEVNGSGGITNGVYGLNPTPAGRGVFGQATASTGFGFGGLFESYSPDGRGVVGHATAGSGTNYGVYGRTLSTDGIGVYGEASADTATGNNAGVMGRSYSTKGYGVAGYVAAANGLFPGVAGAGVYGQSDTPGGSRGVYGRVTSLTGENFAVFGEALTANNWAGYFAGRCHISANLGLGVTSPAFQLHLSQNSAAKPTSNVWTISSDRRLKKNINTIEHALDDLMSLRGVTYQWIDPASQGNMAGTYTGMIAQDVEKVFPEWISDDANGYKSLTVIGFEGIVVEALRELRAEKDAQLEHLTAENVELRARVESLEDMMRQVIAGQAGGSR